MSYSDYIARIQLENQLSAALKRAEKAEVKVAELEVALASQQPADDGWIEWCGRSIPRAVRGRTVQVRYACGETTTEYSGFLNWGDGVGKAVIAYRVVKP